MDTQLLDFTQKALATGCKRGEIAKALQRAGWAGADIDAVLHTFADSRFVSAVSCYVSCGNACDC